jgi:hypothetical protein
MTADWSRVTAEHVRTACERYDTGSAIPKRPAKSTFLIQNGKTYPGKFIRGLAYRLATGVELDPNLDYSGGVETIRFFTGLGLTTRHEPSVAAAEPTPPAREPPPAIQPPIVRKARQEPQKAALAELLRHRFGTIEMEAQFPWLTVPRPDQLEGTTAAIFKALSAMRGFTGFATPGKSLRCDFFVPSEGLIVEYDERQHFTMPRATALELYPPDLELGFDRGEWISACCTIRATDPTPPYRDEQRAFYDSLRDILAAQNGVRLVRLRQGGFDWIGPGAAEHLDSTLGAALRPANTQSLKGEARGQPHGGASGEITKIALVTHDYNVADGGGRQDYSEHFARINRVCDDHGCDTILYALYTWDEQSPLPRTHDAVFGGLAHVRRVVLEVGRPIDSFDHVEVWRRDKEEPTMATQRFATSTSPASQKQAFLNDLDQRKFDDALLVICGETNIASLVRGSEEFFDPYQFASRLGEMKVRLIFNPIHDYMTRYEMRRKRQHYSLGDRTVISVWNQGKGKESKLPWTEFHDGKERTDAVKELPPPFAERPDIRIGVLDLAAMEAGRVGG